MSVRISPAQVGFTALGAVGFWVIAGRLCLFPHKPEPTTVVMLFLPESSIFGLVAACIIAVVLNHVLSRLAAGEAMRNLLRLHMCVSVSLFVITFTAASLFMLLPRPLPHSDVEGFDADPDALWLAVTMTASSAAVLCGMPGTLAVVQVLTGIAAAIVWSMRAFARLARRDR